MTDEKDFKRKVREYASRTGRSYASARHLLLSRSRGDTPMNTLTFKQVYKQEFGFTVSLPEDWSEFPALLSNSPYEVARFACRDHTSHVCLVFRMPGSRGLHPRGTAEQAQARQKSQGFDNFVLTDVDVAGRPGVLLTFDKPVQSGRWAAREYFVTVGSLVYCLGLASGDPQGDASLFDSMAAQFEVAG